MAGCYYFPWRLAILMCLLNLRALGCSDFSRNIDGGAFLIGRGERGVSDQIWLFYIIAVDVILCRKIRLQMPRGAGGISLLWIQKEPQGLSERVFHKIPVGKLLKNQNPLALIVVAVIPDLEEVSESTAVSLRQKHLAVLEQQPHLLFWKALTPNSTKINGVDVP